MICSLMQASKRVKQLNLASFELYNYHRQSASRDHLCQQTYVCAPAWCRHWNFGLIIYIVLVVVTDLLRIIQSYTLTCTSVALIVSDLICTS